MHDHFRGPAGPDSAQLTSTLMHESAQACTHVHRTGPFRSMYWPAGRRAYMCTCVRMYTSAHTPSRDLGAGRALASARRIGRARSVLKMKQQQKCTYNMHENRERCAACPFHPVPAPAVLRRGEGGDISRAPTPSLAAGWDQPACGLTVITIWCEPLPPPPCAPPRPPPSSSS